MLPNRSLGDLLVALIPYYLRGLLQEDFSEGLIVSLVTTITKLVWYYIHEQLGLNLDVQTLTKGILSKPFHGVLLAHRYYYFWLGL